ncbi:hypothetical protein EV2_012136 [Malus domestica]
MDDLIITDKELQMDIELQKILDMACKEDGMEEISECIPPLNTFDGSQPTIDEPDKMLSLLAKCFESREDLIGEVRKIALMQGFATVIRRSKTNTYVAIGCDRGGYYRASKTSLDERKKNSGSRLINCPFEIKGRKKKCEEFWKLEIKSLLHNHELSNDMCGHPSCRQFSQEEILRIKEMSKAGIPPRQILSLLRQGNPHLQVVSRNIYNLRAKIVKESLAGRPVIQALLEELGEGGFTYNIEYDHEGHLTHLIFAHPLSIELTKSYPYVFVMDCTYKTNKYKMPLLDIIGVSSFNTSFYSCFVFMQNEKEEDYVWALKMFSKILGVDNHLMVIITDRELALMNAIRIVFPSTSNLLCVWHIEKNILANCKAHFEEEVDWIDFISTWTILIQSPNETSFNEAWSRFEVKYEEKKFVLKYILGTWLPYKEKFVSAWSEKVTHFGNRVTSRAEGAHATLKKYLQVSTGGLREVKEKICLAIENQFQEIKTQHSSEKVRVSHKFRLPFFKEVVTHVSRFALNELYNQYEASSSSDLPCQCKGHFLKTMGLPCAHMIREMNIEVLQLNDIHPQWRIDRRLFVNDHHVSLDNEQDQISGLLLEFKDKYEKLTLTQKEDTKRQLCEFIDTSLPLTLEPNVKPHKGRPMGSKNRKESSSTKHGPSKFEIVEKAQKRARRVFYTCFGISQIRQ